MAGYLVDMRYEYVCRLHTSAVDFKVYRYTMCAAVAFDAGRRVKEGTKSSRDKKM